MILFFDTETNGTPKPRLPLDHPEQPRIVQLAALLCNPDGTEVGHMNVLVKTKWDCYEWDIPEFIVGIHGICKAQADSQGIALGDALLQFDTLIERATKVVAHNIDFDRQIMEVAYEMVKQPNQLITREHFCTMRSTTDICRIPHGRWTGKFKWPKLVEVHRHFFGESFTDAHDALADVRACARVYFKLHEPR